MQKVDVPKFRKDIIELINFNIEKVKSYDVSEDGSVFTFCGINYSCEITLKEDRVSYDLSIETKYGMSGCGMESNSDNYPLSEPAYEEITLKVYSDLLATVEAIFSGNVYYTSTSNYSYIARKISEDSYEVRFMERKQFLFFPYSSGWEKSYTKTEFDELKLEVLS